MSAADRSEGAAATKREPYRDLLAVLGPVMDLWACDHFPRLGEEVDPECARCQTMGPLREAYAEAVLALVEQDHEAMQAERQRGVKGEPDPRCPFTFPLPWWMGPEQDSPCRCDLPVGHIGDHSCPHVRGALL